MTWQDGPSPSSEAIGAAARRLYRALHLREPLVIEARNAMEFARLCAMVVHKPISHRIDPIMAACLLFAATIVAMGQALNLFHLFGSHDVARSVSNLYVVAAALIFVVIALSLPRRSPREDQLPALLRFGIPATLFLLGTVAGLAFMSGQWTRAAVIGASVMLFPMSAVAFGILSWPIWWRYEARRDINAAIPLRGVRSVRGVVDQRLRSALADALRSTTARLNYSQFLETRRADGGQIIEQEGERLDAQWYQIAPLLGRVVRASPADQVAGLGLLDSDPVRLPEVVRAAAELDRLSDAISVFDRLVIVLPAGAPLAFAPRPALAGPAAPRHADQDVFAWLGYRGPLGMIARLVPGPLTDRILARYIAHIPDAARRTGAIAAMGVERFMAALRARPVHEDRFGRLFLIGRPEDPSAFVEVTDATMSADGSRQRYWRSVPPHMATAHEAVAWTFGRTPETYNPVVET